MAEKFEIRKTAIECLCEISKMTKRLATPSGNAAPRNARLINVAYSEYDTTMKIS
jgi:hypothetical protein